MKKTTKAKKPKLVKRLKPHVNGDGRWTRPERSIYTYEDGERVRFGDPLAILAALMTADVNWETDLRLMMSDPGPDDSPEARTMIVRASFDSLRRIVAAIRTAFDIKPTIDGGLLDAECLDLRAQFVGWLMELKKKANGTPISPSPSPAVWAPSPTTPNTSPSVSTSPAPCTDRPTLLLPESAAP